MAASDPSPTPVQRRADRRARNRAIADARDGGMKWREVAERFGLSERQARRAYMEHLAEAGQLIDVEPAEALRQALNVHVWALDELRQLAANADNSSAAVGAVRSRVTVSHQLIDLLVRAGLLPTVDQAFLDRLRAEQRLHVQAVVLALDERGVEYQEIEDDIQSHMRMAIVRRHAA